MDKQAATTFLVAIAIFLLIAIAWYANTATKSQPSTPEPSQTGCTLEAKICPDGSTVGRTGLNCQFAPCPQETP